MRIEVGIEGGGEFSRLPERTKRALDSAEEKTVRIMQQLGVRSLRAKLSGEDRKRRTGNLARSVTNTDPTRRPDGVWEGRFGYGRGPSARYARILEEGGTITPKNAKVLSIPIGEGLTATGRARYASPRQVPDGFWLSRPGLPPLFLRSVGKAGAVSRIELLFVGVKKVTIQAAHSARNAGAEVQAQGRRILEEQIRTSLGARA